MTDDGQEAAKEAAARKQREQDRQDLWREEGGLPSGRLRRFIFDKENDPRTPEGREKKRGDLAMMRMAETIARWDAQKVIVGGVEMTNAEAQSARRRVLENGDYYARWARERGLIRSGQEEDLLRTVREMHDLSDQERDGSIAPEGAARLEAFRGTEMGQAAQEVTAQAHKDFAMGMARETFPTARQARPEFAAAVAGEPPARSSETPVPAAKPTPAASGFDP